MQLSAEIRWFWRSVPPPGFENWFCKSHSHGYPAGGGKVRHDDYLQDALNAELGIKRRGGMKGVEIKGLVSVCWAGLGIPPFTGPIEIWTKWSSSLLELDANAIISIEKQRWLRKFDTASAIPQEIQLDETEQPSAGHLPALGCNVELTRIGLPDGDIWWTLGFEAFGSMTTVENDLRAVATVLARRHAPSLEAGVLACYPSWIGQYAHQGDAV